MSYVWDIRQQNNQQDVWLTNQTCSKQSKLQNNQGLHSSSKDKTNMPDYLNSNKSETNMPDYSNSSDKKEADKNKSENHK